MKYFSNVTVSTCLSCQSEWQMGASTNAVCCLQVLGLHHGGGYNKIELTLGHKVLVTRCMFARLALVMNQVLLDHYENEMATNVLRAKSTWIPSWNETPSTINFWQRLLVLIVAASVRYILREYY